MKTFNYTLVLLLVTVSAYAATMSVTIPDAQLDRVVNGMAYQQGYKDTVVNGTGSTVPNPESKVQFSKRMLKKWIKDNVTAWEASNAVDAARDSAIVDVENNVDIQD